ncbi:lipopolysaccharide biosynthesis protein [Jeotgalibaca porci]|uniref:Lipopolysaccharide biosynthesis protein n=1 Tax=Jeotgalibaca porci TaxID=1868793 RepID=A0A6G7WG28_9LACT|nr:lipopolysaccharide biosynthesis protein [Jeotgalibaca porci]QIK51206.1 lipopolysaccharide biosynthesis protein [Jeotgalibaca porci]
MATNEFKTGMFFSALGKYSNVIIQLLVNAILSRILTPADYGVVSIVQIFIEFFNLLADMGFGPAIIQNKTLTDEDIGSIFKFSVYLAIVLSVVFMVLGYPVSIFYDNPTYIPIFVILGFSVLFFALLVVPKAVIQKRKDFKTVNQILVLTGVIKGIVSIIFALLGFKYYAIVIGSLVQAIINFLFYYRKTKISTRIKMDLEPIKKIWAFSRNQFSFNFINYFSRNFDSILIGRVFSAGALGYYNKSYQLSLYPNQILAGIITPVIQPIMSEFENNIQVIKNTYLKITRILANIGVPLSVFCVFVGHDIIIFIFGTQWEASVLSFQILSVSIWLQMIASSTGAFYQSSNRTDLLLFSGIQSMILNVSSIAIGVYLGGIETVAMMVTISFSINFLVNNYLLMYRIFESGYLELIKELIKPFIAGSLQLIVFFLLPDMPFNVFYNLLIKGIIFVFVFIIGLIVTGQLKETIKVLKK